MLYFYSIFHQKQGGNGGEDDPRTLTNIFRWGGALAFGGTVSIGLYYIVSELLPTKLAPNAIFNRAYEAIQMDPNIANHFGTPLKAYGRDARGHWEGRRNFIEHENFTSPDDGSKRCRVRFNLQVGYVRMRLYQTVTVCRVG